jgi:hypothetical protein
VQADYEYIAELMEMIHIPQHRNPLEEAADQEAEEHNNITREAGTADRATTHEELRQRLHLKLAEIQAALWNRNRNFLTSGTGAGTVTC